MEIYAIEYEGVPVLERRYCTARSRGRRNIATTLIDWIVGVIACYRQLRIRWVQCVHETVTVTARQCVTWVFHLVCAQRCDVDTENRTLVSSVLARLVSRHCQHGCQWRALG
jgi:hypothetical protein